MSTSTTHHTIPIGQVHQILQGAVQRDIDINALLLRAGISPEREREVLAAWRAQPGAAGRQRRQ